MVNHPTTNRSIRGLSWAERMVCPLFYSFTRPTPIAALRHPEWGEGGDLFGVIKVKRGGGEKEERKGSWSGSGEMIKQARSCLGRKAKVQTQEEKKLQKSWSIHGEIMRKWINRRL